MKFALVQMTSIDDVSHNLSIIKSMFNQAVVAGAELVVFPENAAFMKVGLRPLESLSSQNLSELQLLVNQRGSGLMLTTPMVDPSPSVKSASRFSNSTLLFQPNLSGPETVYNKVHLFDVDVVGAPSVRESDFFIGGTGPALIEFRGWKIGLSICYDLRFAELYLNYGQKADLILVPSAFLVPTGEAHWHTLLKARAIEAQSYLLAPAQSGEHLGANGEKRSTYGHSLAVDPWGRVLLELTASPETAVIDLSKEVISKVRQQIPMAQHRRLV